MIKEITVQEGQSLVDIAIQEYGSAEGLLKVLKVNPEIEQENELPPGTALMIEGDANNIVVAGFFEARAIKVANSEKYISPITIEPYYAVNYIINGYFQ